MKRRRAYKIIADKSLIVQYYAGDVFVDDLIYLQKVISDELDYNPEFDIVADFSAANLVLTKEDLNDYAAFIKGYPKIQGQRKAAYLTSKPNEVVYSTLFSELINDTLIQPHVFSTIKELVHWLDKEGLNKQDLSLVIDELKDESMKK